MDIVREMRDRANAIEAQGVNYADTPQYMRSAATEIERLREALSYYANDEIYDGGDVPGHIYVLDDHGRTARKALGT